jgi:chromate reductase
MKKVTVLVGSLRRESINRRLALAVQKLARGALDLSFVDLSAIPMFNEDLLQPHPPEPVAAMKRAVTEADAVLFVTPEYNRSIPPVLKNAIDWGSRPWGTSCWADKPGAIMGTSRGGVGTAVAQSHLRNVLIVLDVILMGQPEIYLTFKDDHFSEQHEVGDETVDALLKRFVARFDGWIDRVKVGN